MDLSKGMDAEQGDQSQPLYWEILYHVSEQFDFGYRNLW